MQITQTSAEGLKREFSITVAADELAGKVEERLSTVGKTIRLPGFRPGKVPMSLLRRQYGRAVLGEVLEQSVQDTTNQVVNDNGLRPAMQPQIEVVSFDEGQDLVFTMKVELLPEIEPGDFSAIALDRHVVAVGEEEVSKAVANLAKARREKSPIKRKRAAKATDIAVVDFAGTVDGEAVEALNAEGREIDLSDEAFFNAFDGKLVGVKPGENVEVKVSLPENFALEDIAGKEATFTITVKELLETTDVAIDDELAKSFGFDDVAKLNEGVRGQIEGEYTRLTRTRLKRELFDALDKSHSFDLPAGMVDGEFEAIWKQVEAEKEQGRDVLEGKSEDEVKAEYRKIAERRVRLGLLLAEVGRREGIEVTQDELNRAVIGEAQRYGGAAQQVIEYYRKNPQAIESLRAPIFEDKVVDHILGAAKLTDKAVTAEELVKEEEEGEAAA